MAAEWLFEEPDTRAFHALVRTIRDPLEDESVRDQAVRALGRTPGPLAFEILSGLLEGQGPDTALRSTAARALGDLGDPRVLSILLEALSHDRDPYVRAGAAQGLGFLGDPRAVPALIKALDDVEEEGYVRISATGALGELKAAEAVGALGGILLNHGPASEYEREQAAHALGLIGGQEAVDVLRRAAEAETSNEVRRQIAKALRRHRAATG